MVDTGRFIVEAAELVVDSDKDLINIDVVADVYKKKASSINRCLKFIRNSEKKLFAVQQKLIADAKREKEAYSFIKPHVPDLNLLNKELLAIAKSRSPEVYEHFILPTVRKEQIREKEEIARKKARGEIINPEDRVRWIPRIVDAVIFLHTPYEIFPFLNIVREMVCLAESEEQRLYLLSYMERWLYKFTDFLHSYASGVGQDALLTVCFLGKHEHYPVILEVIRFLHQEEHWEGSSAQIQRYNVVRLFLLFKKVLYLQLTRQHNVPSEFNAILSEFTHPFIVEEIDFAQDSLMIITLAYYSEPQRFQFLANLKKKNLEKFINLYQHLLFLTESSSTQPHYLKKKYLEIIKTISRIIKKAHLLTDPKIPETLRTTLRREVSRQILAEKLLSGAAPSAQKKGKKPQTLEHRLAQIRKKATTDEVVAAESSPRLEAQKELKPKISKPPASNEITVFWDIPRKRIYEDVQETPFGLFPDQVGDITQLNPEEINIFQCEDTLFYLIGNVKARGNLKFQEMLEFARRPFHLSYISKDGVRSTRFVNFAYLIAMNMSEDELGIILNLLKDASQLNEEEIDLIKQLYPQLIKDNALGSLTELATHSQSFVAGENINQRIFYEKHTTAAEKLTEKYPYFQQIITYWEFIDQALLMIAKRLDPEEGKQGYHKIDKKKLEKYLSKRQIELFKKMVKELEANFANTFLYDYLTPQLGELMEFKITPDLMRLTNVQPAKIY